MYYKLLTILLCLSSFAQVSNLDYEVIQDPAISLRCKALIEDRNNKILVTQKLKSLLARNYILESKLRASQKLLEQKLLISRNDLNRELSLASSQVQSMEEKIVRSGCPGVSL
jgi:hypothetical protein